MSITTTIDSWWRLMSSWIRGLPAGGRLAAKRSSSKQRNGVRVRRTVAHQWKLPIWRRLVRDCEDASPGRASSVLELGALSDLDNVTVRIPDVAACLAVLRDRLGDELRSSAFPECIARLNIRNAEIHKAVDVIWVGDAERYRRLIRSRPASNIQNDPDIRKLKVRRRVAVPHGQNASAEDLFVVAGRSLDVGDGEKMRDADPFSRRHLVALLFDLYAAHWRLLFRQTVLVPRFRIFRVHACCRSSPRKHSNQRLIWIITAEIQTSTTTDSLPNAGIAPSSDRTAPCPTSRFSATDRNPAGNVWCLGSPGESRARPASCDRRQKSPGSAPLVDRAP